MRMEPLTTEGLVRLLRDRGIGREIVAEVETDTAAQRAALRVRLDALRKREATELPKMHKAVEAARAAAEMARARAEAAQAEAQRAEGAMLSAAHAMETGAAKLSRQLADLAPPEIAELIAECRQRAIVIRNAAAGELTGPRQDYTTSYYRVQMVHTNAPAVSGAIARLDRIIAEAEGLKLADVDRPAILARLADLRAQMPNPNHLEVTVLPSAMNSLAALGEMFRAAETGLAAPPPAPRRRGAAFFR